MKEKYLFDYLAPREKLTIRPVIPVTDIHLKTTAGTWTTLLQEAHNCSKCGLRQTATQVVFGEGPADAVLMLVGEGPGADENEQGKPFVGAAGQLLSKILAAAEIPREEVYITNVVKCRPPKNRTPSHEEVRTCLPYLMQQIEHIKPKIIVCLGTLAAQALILPDARVTAIRGLWHEKHGARVMATFHPAALLRDASKKRPVWEDIQKVRDAYRLCK